MGITGVCYRMVSDLVHAFGVSHSTSEPHIGSNSNTKAHSPSDRQADDLMIRALTAVFGMESNGRIKKEKARRVVDNLGLLYNEDDKGPLEQPGGLVEDEMPVEEVLSGLEDRSKRIELLREAFRIFDEDGDGFIEAIELKRVLQCLGLDKGWDISEIQKMVEVVDLNLDGKVDFSEFELMMGENC